MNLFAIDSKEVNTTETATTTTTATDECRYNKIHSLKMLYLFDLHEKFGVKCVTNVLSNRMSVNRRNIEIQSAVELVRLPKHKHKVHNDNNNNNNDSDNFT